MKTHTALCLLVPVALTLAFSLTGRSRGALPGINNIPSDAARSGPSCGLCHGVQSAAVPIDIDMQPSARSLTRGEAISISLSARGGVQAPSVLGGFAAEVTSGTFSASGTTQIDPTGRFSSHRDENYRAWKFGYTAPIKPGPVEVYAVVNTVDGGGLGGADAWAFHGADPSAKAGTPVHLYVNAPGVRSVGDGCEGSYGSFPILGSDQDPVLGNTAFAVDLVGAPESTQVNLLIGLIEPRPFDLTPIGLTGCTLFVYPLDTFAAVTTAGRPKMAEGRSRFGLPMPTSTVLAGSLLYVQAALLDTANGRSIPLTLTNVLELAIR